MGDSAGGSRDVRSCLHCKTLCGHVYTDSAVWEHFVVSDWVVELFRCPHCGSRELRAVTFFVDPSTDARSLVSRVVAELEGAGHA